METFLVGRTLTSALSIASGILVPFGQVLGVLAGVYVLDKTVDEVIETADEILDATFGKVGDAYAQSLLDSVQLCSSYLLLRGNEGQALKNDWLGTAVGTYPDYHHLFFKDEIPEKIIREQFVIFCALPEIQTGPWKNGQDLVKRWMAFIPPKKILQLIQEDLTDYAPAPVGWWLDLIT